MVLPPFCKHVIVVDFDDLSCIFELGAKFSLLNGCIASIVIELYIDASNNCKWIKAKSIIKHETNNTKEMKVEKPKIQKKKKEDKKKGNELL